MKLCMCVCVCYVCIVAVVAAAAAATVVSFLKAGKLFYNIPPPQSRALHIRTGTQQLLTELN